MAVRKKKNRNKKKVVVESLQQEISKNFIEMHGVVEECLPAGTFKIQLEGGQFILGHLSGKMRMNRIRLLPGDEVKVEMTPYDLTKGRVVYRF